MNNTILLVGRLTKEIEIRYTESEKAVGNFNIAVNREYKNENLQVMTQLEHNRLHKEKLPKIKICSVCGKEFEPPVKHRGRNTTCSKECQYIASSSKNRIQIEQYTLDNNYIKTFNSITETSIEVNGEKTNIVKCLKGKIKSAYGYKWKYSKCFNGNI
jgi:hypothetical protein